MSLQDRSKAEILEKLRVVESQLVLATTSKKELEHQLAEGAARLDNLLNNLSTYATKLEESHVGYGDRMWSGSWCRMCQVPSDTMFQQHEQACPIARLRALVEAARKGKP